MITIPTFKRYLAINNNISGWFPAAESLRLTFKCCFLLRIVGCASDILYLRDSEKKHLVCDRASNQTLESILKKFCTHHLFFGTQSRLSSIMGKMAWIVSECRPFQILKEQFVLHGLYVFKTNNFYRMLVKNCIIFIL